MQGKSFQYLLSIIFAINTTLYAKKPPIINLYEYSYFAIEATSSKRSNIQDPKPIFIKSSQYLIINLKNEVKKLKEALADAQSQLQQKNILIKNLYQKLPNDSIQQTLPKPKQQKESIKKSDSLNETIKKRWQENVLLLKQKRYSEADEKFVQFIKQYPHDNNIASAYYFLGQLALLQEMPEQAIIKFEQFIKKYPGDTRIPEAYFHIGLSHYSMQAINTACKLFKKIEDEYPTHRIAKQALQQRQKIENKAF